MTTRMQLPQEFLDFASSEMLTQPEPQYLLAEMLFRALGMSLDVPAELGLAGRGIGGVGGNYENTNGTLVLSPDGISDAVFAAKIDFKGKTGDTVKINRPYFADTTYTKASRLVARGETISTVPVNITEQQTTITLERFAGPYDQTNSRKAPFAVEDFDASLGMRKAASVVGLHMKRDFWKTMNAFMTVLADTGTKVYPEGYSAVSDFNVAGGAPLSYEYVSKLENAADEANLPTFGDGYRILEIPPCGSKALKTDDDFISWASPHKEMNALFPATYLTSIGKLHIFKNNTLTSTAGSGSIKLYRSHLIAPGAFGAGMGMAPQVRPSTDDNYGMAAKVIWTADMGLELLDNRFVLVGFCTDTE